MRPPHLVHRLGVVQLDVQVLVHALECTANLDFVFELDGDFVLDEGFEETGRGALVSAVVFLVRARGGLFLGRCGCGSMQ